MPQIEVTFDLDANGILNVGAKDLGTGKEVTRRIEQPNAMSKDEIDKMKRDAELHADDDKKKRELADAKNEAENKIFSLEKLLKESGEKVAEADKAAVTRAIDKVKGVKDGTDLGAIKTAVSELDTASQALAQHLYAKPGADGGPAGTDAGATPSGGEKPKGDDVIDAEYEVKK